MFQMQKKCFRRKKSLKHFFASETYFQCFETYFQCFETCFQCLKLAFKVLKLLSSSQRQKSGSEEVLIITYIGICRTYLYTYVYMIQSGCTPPQGLVRLHRILEK